jgi:hypothetical protein
MVSELRMSFTSGLRAESDLASQSRLDAGSVQHPIASVSKWVANSPFPPEEVKTTDITLQE